MTDPADLLREDELPTARRAAAVLIPTGASASGAFVAVANECMNHWRANVAGVVTDRDIEALHQTRVGVRRLRSAYALFRRTLRHEPEFLATGTELRRRAAPLGPARDLDVLIAGPLVQGLDTHRMGLLRDRREAAYDDVVDLLTGPQWSALAGRVDAFLTGAPWSLTDDPPVRAIATEALDRRWARVMRRGRRLRELTPAQRHGVRIEAKKLRYGAQFFASLYGGTDAGMDAGTPTAPLVFAEVVAVLQDRLGDLNDVARAQEVLRSLGATPPDISAAALLDDAERAWQDLAALRPFWR